MGLPPQVARLLQMHPRVEPHYSFSGKHWGSPETCSSLRLVNRRTRACGLSFQIFPAYSINVPVERNSSRPPISNRARSRKECFLIRANRQHKAITAAFAVFDVLRDSAESYQLRKRCVLAFELVRVDDLGSNDSLKHLVSFALVDQHPAVEEESAALRVHHRKRLLITYQPLVARSNQPD